MFRINKILRAHKPLRITMEIEVRVTKEELEEMDTNEKGLHSAILRDVDGAESSGMQYSGFDVKVIVTG